MRTQIWLLLLCLIEIVKRQEEFQMRLLEETSRLLRRITGAEAIDPDG
jgi:hypothetical protein